MFEKVSPYHPDEEWRDIPGYEGKYWVSSYGRIRNKNKIMKPMICSNGYLSACLWKNNVQKKVLLHRLVAIVFVPNPSNYPEVNHKDGVKTNNCATNLEWCTRRYNLLYGGIIEKLRVANTGRVHDDKFRQKISLHSLGRIWINNGVSEKFIKKDERHNYEDWKCGRLPRRW